MSGPEPQAFVQRMRRVETLIHEIEQAADPATRTAAQMLVQELLDLHRDTLVRACESLSREQVSGRAILQAWSEDELVGNVLLLHGLHPRDLQSRVLSGLDKARTYLHSHGGDVELLHISEGTVYLRLLGSCHGCPSSAATLKSTIEQAIYDAAPDVTTIEIESPTAESEPAAARVQLGKMPSLDAATQIPERTAATT